mmetsp:Transcript_13045/g.19631  ORF Transcript_13045/g.19631 Transcript_13045/m.19631 type:complete len:226 (+) Transcript_13045:95-772(+)
MVYEPDHVQGNKPPRLQHFNSSNTYITGKIDQGELMANDWQPNDHLCHPNWSSPLSVRFNIEKTTVFQYEADDYDEREDVSLSVSLSSRRRSRSEEVSFKTNTNRSIMAYRQELVDAGEDVYVSSNVRQRRNSCRKGGLDDIEHLISSVSIRKNVAQILARKQVIRAVLDEQARQRRCNQFDYTLIAIKSIEHSRVSIERARMIGFTNHADIDLLETKSSNYLES